MGTQPPPQKGGGALSPIFGQCLLRSNGCMDQDATWYGGRPRPRRHCVRWGHNRATSPIFGSCILWPNSWMHQGGTWHAGGPWSRPHCARWGPSFPSQKNGHIPIFGPRLLWPNVWMDIDATGTKVGVGPGRILCYMGTQLPLPKKGAEPPIFGPCLLGPNGCMDHDATWYGVGLGPGHIVLHGDPRPPPLKRGTSPNFWPMSIVAKRSPISATAEHLLTVRLDRRSLKHFAPLPPYRKRSKK